TLILITRSGGSRSAHSYGLPSHSERRRSSVQRLSLHPLSSGPSLKPAIWFWGYRSHTTTRPRLRAPQPPISGSRLSIDTASAQIGRSHARPRRRESPEGRAPASLSSRERERRARAVSILCTWRIGQRQIDDGPSPLPWYSMSTSTFHDSHRAT